MERDFWLAACVFVCAMGCGRIGFDAPGDAARDGSVSNPAPPTAHTSALATVDTAGITDTGSEADGTHLVFVDNTPGQNGNLVIFREGDNGATIKAYVSADAGATWQRFVLAPTNTVGLNAMGACQDTVNHAFHLAWLDTATADQYARVIATYTGGDITGFTVGPTFPFFDDGGDSPGPRDLAEIIDGAGNHRLVFAGTGPSTGTSGRYKLAVTTVGAGLVPASQNDWAKASDHTQANTNDQLLANNFATADGPQTYMVSVSSNLAGGTGAPIVIAAGLPADKKLLVWTVTPTGTDFTVGAPQAISTAFGAGTGSRLDASLSLTSAPSGDTWLVYGEQASGLHVASVSIAGAVAVDAIPQPTTSTQARHAVIATDDTSRPAVIYADGAGHLLGSLLFNSAWLPAAQISTVGTPAGAWSVSSVWRPGGVATFGVYRDAGAAEPTTFSQVFWQ